MDLDNRLKKIAPGMSVTDAVDAYMSRLAEQGKAGPDPQEERRQELLAIVEIMFLMAAADGEVAEEEIQELRASVHAIQDIEEIDDIDLLAVMRELAEKLETEGWSKRVESAAARIKAPEARIFAFQLAAGVAFVDDFVADAEADAIDQLARTLGLPKDDSQALLREVHVTLFGG